MARKARKRIKKGVYSLPESIAAQLNIAGDRKSAEAGGQAAKRKYAEDLTDALAVTVADSLRQDFPGILPLADGSGKESPARTVKGTKRLDVNYSTSRLGMALGVSLKSVNFPEGKRKNYAKNVTARDNELRAEAEDYHSRQRFAVMIALYIMPFEACDNATNRSPSSFGHTVKILRYRSGRRAVSDPDSLFEKVYVGLYEHEGTKRGDVAFFDVENDPPWQGRPKNTISFATLIEEIKNVYDDRNDANFLWSDRGVEKKIKSKVDEPSVDES
jgi:hypothetical protein